MIRRKWSWLVSVGWVLAVYAPNSSGWIGSETVPAETSKSGQGIESRLNPPELYERVKAWAELRFKEVIAPNSSPRYRNPGYREGVRREFQELGGRVERLQTARNVAPIEGFFSGSKMFARWERLQVGGEKSPMETAAVSATRGGPDHEVILANGELVLEQEDMSLPTRGGMGFRLVRYFRSHVEYEGPLGPGWDHNCNARIVGEGPGPEPNTLIWYTGERAIRFDRQGKDWVPEPGAFYRLEMVGPQIKIETPEQVRWEFEPSKGLAAKWRWRIARIASRHDQWRANGVQFAYWPGRDLLKEVEDPFGNRIRFVHDDRGRLQGVEAGGYWVLYEYDRQGCLSQVQVPQVALTLTQVRPVNWQYQYRQGGDGRTWLVSFTMPGGFLKKTFEYQWNQNAQDYGRVRKVIFQGQSNPQKAEKMIWEFEQEASPRDRVVVCRPPAPAPLERWTFGRNQRGVQCYPSSRSIPSQKAQWTWKYNPAGQRVEEQRPLGGVVQWEYDSDHRDPRFRGNLLSWVEKARPGYPSEITERGWRWTYHTEIALPTLAVAYQRNRSGQEEVLQITKYEYDPKDLDLSLEQTGERTRRWVRNRYGLPVVQWDGRGCGRVTEYYAQFQQGQVGSENGGLVARIIEDASSEKIQFALRAARNPLKPAHWPQRSAEGNPCERIVQYRYDRQGRLAEELYPSYTRAWIYNPLGMVLAMLDTRSDLMVMDYDQGLRQVNKSRRIEPRPGAAYPGEKRSEVPGCFTVERLDYDDFGRLIAWNSTLEPFPLDGTDQEAKAPPQVRYEYYPSGALKRRVSEGGTAVEIEYDQSGRPKTYLLKNRHANDHLVLQKEMTYDAEGFLLEYQGACNEKFRFEPDAFGRQWCAHRPDGVKKESIFDGLDRQRQERYRDQQNHLLSETQYEYDQTGRLVKTIQRRLGERTEKNGRCFRIDQSLVAEENQYDPEGYLTAQRSYQKDAWAGFGYDGLGRRVWRKSPEGDLEKFFYHRDWLCVSSQYLGATRNAQRSAPYSVHTVILSDQRGKPWCTVPVGTDGKEQWERAVLTQYDAENRCIWQYFPNFRKTCRVYNTLGLLEEEKTFPASPNGADNQTTLSYTKNIYAADGLLLRHEIDNEPLVLVQTRTPGLVEIKRQKVPQCYQKSYDEFRRLLRDIYPDGLIHKLTYGPDSRVCSLVRFHKTQPETQESLAFQYDSLGRITAVLAAPAQTPLQQFKYDWQGNVIEASDLGQPEYPVHVQRTYDNLGQMLAERVQLPRCKPPAENIQFVYDYDLAQGTQTMRIEGMDQHTLGWQTLVGQLDRTGRLTELQKDGQPFCRFDYLGSQAMGKHLCQVPMEEYVSRWTPLLEPAEHLLKATPRAEGNDASAPKDQPSEIYRMHYLRDGLGRITASSVCIPSRKWKNSQFCDRDAAGNIAAEEHRAQFYETAEALAEERKHILESDQSKDSAKYTDWAEYHVHRRVYDQLGNLMVQYRGPRRNVWPKKALLSSAADPNIQGAVGQAVPIPAGPLASPQAGAEGLISTTWEKAPNALVSLPDTSLALASNRVVCKASVVDELGEKAAIHTRYQYDSFGRLLEYHSETTGVGLRWKIEYDLLGRVICMKGFEEGADRHEQDSSQNNEPIYTLYFAYDPFHRRIVKKVDRRAPTSSALQVMLYSGDRPILKLIPHPQQPQHWLAVGQYLWGNGNAQILAYYEGNSMDVNRAQDQRCTEYLLHQDLSRNVFLSTQVQNGKVDIYDLASFWGWGSNSTTGIIKEIKCSLPAERGRDPQFAYDGILDSQAAAWINDQNKPGFLTIQLTNSHRFSSLAIWADKLPQKFRVYVVQGNAVPTEGTSLLQWENRHQDSLITEVQHQEPIEVTSPVEINLRNPEKKQYAEGHAIVLTWQKSSSMSVREFEVCVQPKSPGDLAFSGSIYDFETGLYYHGARYRLPELDGKFISPDPLGFLAGDNLYAFAHNDPLSWHDPDGRFAHILIGAVVGAGFGTLDYLWHWWWYGEEFSWKRLGVYAGAGAAAGAIGAFVGPLLSTWGGGSLGLSAIPNAVITSTATGAVAGSVHNAVQSGGITYLDTGSLSAVMTAALHGALEGALWGAIGGFVGGSVISSMGGSFWGFTVGGAAGGGTVGLVEGAREGWQETGTWQGALQSGVSGALTGAAVGGAIGAAAWGVGRSTRLIRPLPEQPEGLPDPRKKGILIRTETEGIRESYGGLPQESGFERHHMKPVSLGGPDSPSNIVKIRTEVHRQPHPGFEVKQARVGTIFY